MFTLSVAINCSITIFFACFCISVEVRGGGWVSTKSNIFVVVAWGVDLGGGEMLNNPKVAQAWKVKE